MHQEIDQGSEDKRDIFLFFDDQDLCAKIDEIFKKNNYRKMQREILELRLSQITGKDVVLPVAWSRSGFNLLGVEYYKGITYRQDPKGYIHPRFSKQLDILY